MTQTGPDKLTVTDGKSTRVYDFVKWKIYVRVARGAAR